MLIVCGKIVSVVRSSMWRWKFRRRKEENGDQERERRLENRFLRRQTADAVAGYNQPSHPHEESLQKGNKSPLSPFESREEDFNFIEIHVVKFHVFGSGSGAVGGGAASGDRIFGVENGRASEFELGSGGVDCCSASCFQHSR